MGQNALIMRKLVVVWVLMVTLVLAGRLAAQVTNEGGVTSALGGPIVTDGSWVGFTWTAGPGVLNDAGAGTFTGAFQLDITDFSRDGDRFEVYDFGVLIGTTSVPVDDGFLQGDPDLAFADPRFSSGSFVLGAGSHSITIRTIQIATGLPDGAGFVRLVTVVPALPPTGILVLAVTLLIIASRVWFRRRSLV